MDLQQLLYDLYNAKNSESVYNVVEEYCLNNSENWHPYGGNQNNAGTFENQQSSPENALVEKITNSIDAILMKQCLIRGINPRKKEMSDVPQDMFQAVENFWGVKDGRWENVTASERNEVAQNLQIVLSSDKKTPNVAVFDNGEGQNPADFPNTFLSIAHGNKNDIPFVQGKYNFGATGAVVFCGEVHRYQMIISRRSPELKDSDGQIGFTLVRRHILTQQEEREVKLTWYEYLVINNEIPSIKLDKLDLGLNNNMPFVSGTVVKMFSYQLTRPSMATMELWRKLNPLLFVSAIPVLIYETRSYRGNTPTKPMLGNRTRLALDGREKIEFKKSLMLMLFGSKVPVMVYIFKQGTSNDEFIDKKSVIYILNGQTQGVEPRTFISQEIGYRNLRDYMLVAVDCSQIGTTARQELFMASRDRLKKGRYYNELRDDIISLLKNDSDISQKDQEYKGKTFKESKKDKDMIETYFSRFKSNPDVRKILSGNNGSFSFYNKKASAERKQSNDRNNNKQKAEKKLQRYPSIFKVKGFDADSKEYIKAIKKGGKGRIILETDVENDFLTRSSDNGSIEITTLDYGDRDGKGDHFILPNQDAQKLKVQIAGPYDGEIRVIVEPKESAEVGERIPLSIKMISSVGEYEVVVFIRVEQEDNKLKEAKKKTIEQPELILPQLIRVVKENPSKEELTWKDRKMNEESIVNMVIASDGSVDTILINMDSNLVKKLINKKGVDIERVRNRYITSVYSHSLMIYTTMYGYYAQEGIDLDKHVVQQIQDDLQNSVEFSFRYYAGLLMSDEEFLD
ncbi:MAG: hypothetical protein HFG80_06200 [Eubacterium sp.]|nr:hypothetical protein [Eubacterium sp.]